MTTRDALTPDMTNSFVVPNTPGGPSNSAVGLSSPLNDVDEEEEIPSKCLSTLSVVSDFMKNNIGLLLVAAAQAFFSFMGVAVKILHRIDPPVSTLQVCSVVTCHVNTGNQLARFVAHSCSDGESLLLRLALGRY